MKNLVTKIALLGAILAFAMVLFGGSAYVYSSLTTWKATNGDDHIAATYKQIDRLKAHIDNLSKRKAELESELQTQKSNSEKEIKELSDQIKALNGEKETLNEQLSNIKDTSSKEASDLREQIKKLTETIADKDKLIADKDKLMDKTIEITNAGKVKQQERIRDLRAQVASLTTQVTDLTNQVKSKQSYEDDHDSELNKAVNDAKNLLKYAQDTADDADKKVNTNTLNQ